MATSRQMDDTASAGSPAESLELRKARRLIAMEECLEWDHEVKVNHDGDAVCQRGCGTVFHVTYSHIKELRDGA